MRLRHAIFAALFASVVGYALTGADWFRDAAEVGALGMLSYGATRRTGSRVAWGLVVFAGSLWVAGDVAAGATGDVLYLVSYALAYPALVLMLYGQARPLRAWFALDGVLAALAVAALLSGLAGDAMGVATLSGDTLLVTTVVLAFALSGWRPSRGWFFLALAEATNVWADLVTVGRPEPSHAVRVGWMFAFMLVSFAAWQPSPRPIVRPGGWSSAAVPLGGCAVSICLLVHAGLTDLRPLTIWFAGGALVVGLARATLLIAENIAVLNQHRHDALTDKLTGLPNRRALLLDLEAAVAGGRAHTLAFFDLDGFKEYNDAFGHAAGDALLQRIGPALAGYRLGGDEFCLLLDGALEEDDPQIARAVDALSERGDGFSVAASFGLVVLPDEARDGEQALRLADERMYARKRRRRAGHGGQARDVLVQVLAEHGLQDHRVAHLAALVGRELELDAEELDVLVRAAELHDVGKVAVPDEILAKTGPLDDRERAIMRQHPVTGERILAVAPSMRPVARLVRSTHERWDGTGYPDGLQGEAIPLGARIIAACEAQVAGEPLHGFDPRVIETLTQVCQGAATLAADGRADDPRSG